MNEEEIQDIAEGLRMSRQTEAEHQTLQPTSSSASGRSSASARRLSGQAVGDDNHTIRLSDLQLLMRTVGQSVDSDHLQKTLNDCTDHEGVDFPMFLKSLDTLISDTCSDAELKRAFGVFDPKHRGKVTFAEMRDAVLRFTAFEDKISINVEELEEIFSAVSSTENQEEITFEEFLQTMKIIF